jgi:hypothetical protein
MGGRALRQVAKYLAKFLRLPYLLADIVQVGISKLAKSLV